jgi:hypothetical protein
MKAYVLRVEFSIAAPDDPAARAEANQICEQLGAAAATLKLQERSTDKPPRNVAFNRSPHAT